MRSPFGLFAVLVLLAAGLAGCVGEEPLPSTDAVAGADDAGPETPAADANESLVDDGSREDDASLGEQAHIHDYWHGAERLTIMDEDVTVDPFTGIVLTFFNVFQGTPGVGGAFLELPEGSIVFEGTGELQFTATWSDATVTGMGLRYRSAEATQFSEEQPLQQGSPLVVPVTPEMTDMPHAKSSRWMFFLTPANAGESMVGTFHVKVDIVKTRDPTMYPGHPDLFGDASVLELFRGSGSSAQTSFAQAIANAATQTQTDDSIQSAKVVPMDALSMTANLTVTSATTTLGEVGDVWVEYKSADSFGYRRAQMLAGDAAAGAYQFAWPVEMQQTDSPYAKESAWRFRVRATSDPTGQGDTQIRGVSDVKVDFDLVVVAYDALLPGIEPVQDERGR